MKQDFLFSHEGEKPFPQDPPTFRSYSLRMRRADWHPHYRIPVIKRAGGFCERCFKKTRRYEVHHLTYERFGRELMDDLQALCGSCHRIADMERKRLTRRRWGGGCDAGEAAWCARVFGEDPSDWPDDAAERFQSCVGR